jgi:hypothetical protein
MSRSIEPARLPTARTLAAEVHPGATCVPASPASGSVAEGGQGRPGRNYQQATTDGYAGQDRAAGGLAHRATRTLAPVAAETPKTVPLAGERTP